MEEQFNREAKEGLRFAADAARITEERAGSEVLSTRRMESLLQSKVTWEQFSEKEKDPRQRGMNHPSTGKCARIFASFFGVLLALGSLDPEERGPAGGSVEASQSHQTSVADGM